MKLQEINQFTFKKLGAIVDERIAQEASRHLILHYIKPADRNERTSDIVALHQSASSGFCRAVVSAGYLSQEQMNHAAQRYRLGMARDGGVIFWQIGSSGRVYDGKIMYYRPDCHRDHNHLPTWVSSVLKSFFLAKSPELAAEIQPPHCLFGTHLLDPGSQTPVAIVEAEKTAVIMSEIYPDYLWLAAGGLNELTASKLFPCRGRKIILFPDTDEHHQAYNTWYKISREAQFQLGHPIHLSPLLERNATRDQKRRKIDLVDYYFENQLASI
ncbi:MAG: hypothetical protein IJ580_05880 [Prevotella sp.]|nr:hypothetical protein [Prevotella sp.]